MSSLVVSGDVSGSVTLSAPSAAGSVTVTLPSASGTMSVNGPAFSAYLSSNQVVSSGVFTKVTFQTEEFDTNSNYDNATNYRFTPTVAGYYQVNACVQQQNSLTVVQLTLGIYKNGALFKIGNNDANGGIQCTTASALIYCNGSTDYIEIYGYNQGTGTVQFLGLQTATYFQAAMVRGA